jgi:hypothetical protein
LKNIIASFLVATAISGCAEQIMGDMVGQDITTIQAKYGPPINKMTMPDGRIAFQWRMDQSYAMPTYATTNTVGNVYGTGYGATYVGTTNTQINGGGIVSQTCFYTLYTQKNNHGSYTVTSFEKPTFDCN